MKPFTVVAVVPTGKWERARAAVAEGRNGPLPTARRLYEQIAGTIDIMMVDGRPSCIYWDGEVFYTAVWDRRADSERAPVMRFSPLDMGEGRLLVLVHAD